MCVKKIVLTVSFPDDYKGWEDLAEELMSHVEKKGSEEVVVVLEDVDEREDEDG